MNMKGLFLGSLVAGAALAVTRKLGILCILIAFLAGCAPASPTPTPPVYWRK
jgi:hypothetical protein